MSIEYHSRMWNICSIIQDALNNGTYPLRMHQPAKVSYIFYAKELSSISPTVLVTCSIIIVPHKTKYPRKNPLLGNCYLWSECPVWWYEEVAFGIWLGHENRALMMGLMPWTASLPLHCVVTIRTAVCQEANPQ